LSGIDFAELSAAAAHGLKKHSHNSSADNILNCISLLNIASGIP
jgi:hypothetical protein